MGAAGAEHRGPDGQGPVQLVALGQGAAEGSPDPVLGELAQEAQLIFAQIHPDAQVSKVGLDDGVQLLHHGQLLHLTGEVLDDLLRQGVHQAQLQHADLRQGFLHVLVADAGGDDAPGGVAHLHPVEGTVLAVFPELLGPCLHHHVLGDGVAGGHDVLAGVLHVLPKGRFLPVVELHQALGVGDPGAGPEEYRRVKFLGQLEGQPHEVPALPGVGGLHHGHLGANGVVPGVLLVLGGVHAGIVGHGDDQPPVDAGVGGGVQGVGGHVQSHVLHGAHGPGPGDGRAESRLQGALLIGRPFGVDLRELGRFLGDLRGGRARVGGYKGTPRLKETPCGGGVAQQQLLHVFAS